MNAPWKSPVAETRNLIHAYVCDDVTLDVVRGVCEEIGWTQDKLYKGGLRTAIQSLSVSASPQTLLVDLSESSDPIADINSLAEVCEPGTIVIALGEINDVGLYRDLLMSGLQDYLLKPLSRDALWDSFANAQAMLNAPKHEESNTARAHISTAVIGTRGGSGASTIAASLAWTFSQDQGHQTGLLDLDIHFGTAALTMDLEPGRGLTDAIDNPSRIDGLFIERAMIKANDQLSILSAEAPMNNPVLTDGSAFFRLQEEFRAAFENTVIDLPRSMLIAYPRLMHDVNIAVVTTELTLASARDSIRVLAWLKQNAPHCKVLVIANNVQNAVVEITRKDFENTIERKIDLMLPADPKAMAQAAKLGKSVVEAERSSKLSLGISALAEIIAGSSAEMAEADAAATRVKAKKSPFAGFKNILKKK